jgi:hypothetical protein
MVILIFPPSRLMSYSHFRAPEKLQQPTELIWLFLAEIRHEKRTIM